MTGLETAFYIIAIIYMVLMFALFVALLVAVLVIKSKINKVHDTIDEKVGQAKAIADKANVAVKTVKNFVKR